MGLQRSPGLLVPKIEGLARPIGDWIVGPRRQLMLAAVHRPGVTAALRGHLETEAGIGDHVDPRGGRRLARAEDRHIFAAALGEATQAIEELHAGRPDARPEARKRAELALRVTRGEGLAFGRALKLIGEPSARSDQDDTRDGREKGPHLRRDQVGAQHEGVPGWPLFADLGPGLAGPHQGLQRDLKFLNVG